MSKEKKHVNRLYLRLLIRIVIPFFILAVALLFFVYYNIRNMKLEELYEKLEVYSDVVYGEFDEIYPGDYSLSDPEYHVVKKGDVIINGDYSVIDKYKEFTDCDFSLFYGPTRILTTLKKGDERVVMTGVNPVVKKEVLEKGKAGTYTVDINGAKHIVRYTPIKQGDRVVGMFGVSCPMETIYKVYMKAVIPFILFFILMIAVIGTSVFGYSRGVIREVEYIDNSLKRIEAGQFKGEIEGDLLQRKDEFGDIGKRIMSMRQELKILVEYDKLTGIFNRSSGQKMYSDIVKRAKVTGTNFVVVLCDIDHFKRVNDTYGHDCGDKVLVNCADVMKNNVMRKGFVCRWGGEEFLIVFDGADVSEAMSILENIRYDLKQRKIDYEDKDVDVTMTFGVVDGDVNESMESIVKRCDDKLYYGKNNGRNQIVY